MLNTRFFFNSLPVKYRSLYKDFYTYQNLIAVRAASIIFLLLNIIIRVLYVVFPASLTKAQNFPEFNTSNWVFLIITPFFLIAANLLILEYKRQKKSTQLMAFTVFLFSLYIITCGMYSSFIATSDPSNSLTLYLIALCLISATVVFEYYESIILIIGVELFFTALLLYSQTSPTQMVYNQLISVVLLSAFYLTSRYFFTYKANSYQQVLQISEKNELIEGANVFKNQVLGMVAHDLRNPIASVESIAMMMELDEVTEDTQDNLNMIKESCAKARSIIDDLLDAARNENGRPIETERTELNQLLKTAVDSWRTQGRLNVDVIFISSVNPAYALINKERFSRVIDNLVSNAVKFSKDNSRVDVRLSQVNKDVIIEVQDYGMGIPEAMLPEIFNRFTKAGRTGVRGEKSTGLGLSIVRQIVESHKGTIHVESTEGKGSVFVVKLPVS
ncbi:HAMP domain-containing sensor histidine kinase [Mucilaginibacter sp. KACC 22773]|jgi:signal transduction histidine kinase|uniref:sensor histidine kinase n=1 Tax=Mucilaginibacter sp. KACC 22773 TaxID=3025671 RepID=UPI002365E0DF|nr:HAMP domain-containing sensor histidine kinase [Mucilaginibacter sp. KACC 22773]WDF81405.1 HAMP domain-containing sensor histidine kinase [Mucilaginibacter sp. KACC 22773]